MRLLSLGLTVRRGLVLDCRRNAPVPVRPSGPRQHRPRAHRQGDLRRRRRHGRRRRQRQEGHRHRQRGERRQGRIQLPGEQARRRRLYAHCPRHRLRAAGAEDRDARGRQACRDRRQARQDPQPRLAAHQSRMDAQRAGLRRAEARAHRLHELPQRRTHPEFELQRRGVPASHQADGAVFQQQLLQEAADPPGRARHQSLRPERRQGRRLFRQHQPQRRRSEFSSSRPCRASAAPAPKSSSPNTICRSRPSSRTT